MTFPVSDPVLSPRVAIVAGLRTPFAKQGTAFAALTAIELGARVVRELVGRTGVAPAEVERVVFGQVVPTLATPNVAREVALEAGLPPDTDAYAVSRACATGYQATIDVARAIAAGEIACGIAGGTDSISDVPVAVSRKLGDVLLARRRGATLARTVQRLAGLSAHDLVPAPPALAERSTGMTMGEHAEDMARKNGITREAQDAFAHASHSRAAAAWADGRLAGEVIAVDTGARVVREDNLVRKHSRLADYAAMRPVFDRARGTVTAGNSSALTDGASALLLLREDRARALGLAPLAFVRSHAFVAVDPRDQLLIGPAVAIPRALDRAGVRFADLALLDLHEAFAAQVLSVTQALERRYGPIDPARINVTGGSIAIGHPFAATGARQLTQTARELARRGGGLACVAACAAGGLGAAIVLEVEP